MQKNKCALQIASCGGLGYSRYAPGTVASCVAMGSYGCLSVIVSWDLLCIITGILVCVGWWATTQCVTTAHDDPSWIVIDEWVAVWGLCLALPSSVTIFIVALCVFRLLDIAKPWPISWAQDLPGVLGVFADDVAAAVLTYFFIKVSAWLFI